MAKVHGIVDYSFLYYKYVFSLESGRMRRLSTIYDDGVVAREKDISKIYYSMREIEGFRRGLENQNLDVTMSICFDMPSKRKATEKIEGAKGYKSNRAKKLNEEDFNDISLVMELLSEAGHNTYRLDGYEADDIVFHLINKYADEFDYNIIYTPDADLLVNIKDNVAVYRYKTRGGYSVVNRNNFEQYLSSEMKCRIPYNSLMLAKSTIGDKSDNIDGINRFGPKAFDKLVDHLESRGIDWCNYNNYENTLKLINSLDGYLKEDQIIQAIESLSLVRPMIIADDMIKEPIKKSSRDLREKSYMKLDMKSLVD